MLKSYAAIMVTITLFSTIEVVTKHIAADVDIFFLAFVRFFVAGVLILAIGGGIPRRMSRRDLWALPAVAVVGVPLAFGTFHLSLRTLNASTGAVIFSLNPVFSALAGAALLGERLAPRSLLGLLLGLCGVYVVSFGIDAPDWESAGGPLLMMVSAVAFGIYIAAAKRYVRRYGPLTVTGLMFTSGSLLLLPFVRGTVHGGSAATLGWIAYLTLAATGLAYVLYFYGLSRLSLATGTSVFYLKPLIASLTAKVVLDESLPPHFIFGVGVILVALVLTVQARRQGQSAPE